MKTGDNKILKLVSSKIVFLREQLLIVDEIIEDAYQDFNEELSSRNLNSSPSQEEPQVDPGEEPPTHQEQDLEKEIYEIEKKNKDPALRRIFKKIAQVIHPDRLVRVDESERESKTLLFRACRKAFDEDDYFFLHESAKALNIKLPPPTEHEINLFYKLIEKLNQEIEEKQKTIAWVWYHSSEEEKELLMSSYLEKHENDSRA